MRKASLLAVILAAFAVVCSGVDLTELGFRLSLEPHRQEGRARLWITVGAYGRIVLNEEWRLRIVAGSGITAVSPFVDLGLVRAYTPRLMAEWNLALKTLPGRGLVSTARLGGRYVSSSIADARIEATTFPVGWRLTSHGSELRGDLFASANLTLDVTIGSPGAGLIGQGLTLTALRRSVGSEPPMIPLGGTWCLATELVTHIGVDLYSSPSRPSK